MSPRATHECPQKIQLIRFWPAIGNIYTNVLFIV